MTVGELKEKLSLYKDDEEIFISGYDDILRYEDFCPPSVVQEDVDANYSKTGYLYYSNYRYIRNSKKATILVIRG